MGVERHKKETTACPKITEPSSYYHIWEESRGTKPLNIVVPAQCRRKERSGGWEEWLMGCLRAMNRPDRWDRGCASGTEGSDRCWQKVLIWKNRDLAVCIWSLSLSMTDMLGKRARTQIWLPSLISHFCKQTPLFDSWHGCHQLGMEKSRDWGVWNLTLHQK